MGQEADSPFIAGTKIQHSFDNTSLTWFMDCPRKYYYAMIEGWEPKDRSPHLTFGLHYHSSLEHFDVLRAQGSDYEDALREVVLDLLRVTWGWESPHKTKNRESLVRSVIWYLEEFRDDPARTFILQNGKPAVELSFKAPLADFKLHDHQVLWCGHLDRVVNYMGELFVTDRKTTTSSLGTYYFEGYDLDRQMTGYTYAGQVVLNTQVKGVIIDAAQLLVSGTAFGRGLTYRSSSQLEEWLDNTMYWIDQAAEAAVLGQWPMNETSCNKYRSNDPTAHSNGCVFKSICSKPPGSRPRWLEADFIKRSWNPLASR